MKNDSVLKKEFKHNDVNRLRNLVQGKYGDRTTMGTGYTKAKEFHDEGDVWEEDGRSWTIKNGVKQNITKLDKAKEGMHKYPAALTDPALATGDEYDVSFLGYPHRHIFHFKVWIGVTHDDRDIEFIQFKRWLENLYSSGTLQLDYKSCEMMSGDLYDSISNKI